jgi:hypothetical protein
MAPSKKSTTKANNKSALAETPRLPDWPVFKPLLPTSDLSLTSLVESQIVVIRNFWTSSLCKNYVSFLSSLPLVTTPGKPKRGDALRVNDRYEVHDPAFANRLWIEAGLRELICGSENDTGEELMSRQEREQLW